MRLVGDVPFVRSVAPLAEPNLGREFCARRDYIPPFPADCGRRLVSTEMGNVPWMDLSATVADRLRERSRIGPMLRRFTSRRPGTADATLIHGLRSPSQDPPRESQFVGGPIDLAQASLRATGYKLISCHELLSPPQEQRRTGVRPCQTFHTLPSSPLRILIGPVACGS